MIRAKKSAGDSTFAGFTNIGIRKDFSDLDRIAVARKPPS